MTTEDTDPRSTPLTDAENAKSLILSQKFTDGNREAKVLADTYKIGVDPDAGKFEAFQMYLVKLGILTREQIMDFEIEVMDRCLRDMNNLKSEAEAKRRSASLIKPNHAGTKLLGLDGNPLLGKKG